jgi:hypothetical protein
MGFEMGAMLSEFGSPKYLGYSDVAKIFCNKGNNVQYRLLHRYLYIASTVMD